jgi:hypothetical protein
MQDDGSTRVKGALSSLTTGGREFDWVLQRHKARRAGLHLDARLGDASTGLLSWAVPKAVLPERRGESVLVIEQPVHRHSSGSFEGVMPDLLIIDDMGLKQLPGNSAEYLFEVVMRRYENRSTIMTSNRPIEEWGKLLGDVRPLVLSWTASCTMPK